MSIEAMKMALKALESAKNNHGKLLLSDPPQDAWRFHRVDDAVSASITALRQAIEQAEQAQPVAWRYALDASVEGPRWIYIDKDPHQWLQGLAMVNAAIEELHTSPQPSKPWVGLTDEEVSEVIDDVLEGGGWLDVARALEAAIKRKNA